MLVRGVVGVLVVVGRGALVAGVAGPPLLHRSPRRAGDPAPAAGLFLERVYYPGDPRDLPVQPAVVIRPTDS
jgi:tRNA U38,U39,U40 pseudouridine synthase TruA